MKKIFSRILAVGLLSAGIIGVSSCDYLDQKPENLKTCLLYTSDAADEL